MKLEKIEFHDAILKNICFEWRNKCAVFEIMTGRNNQTFIKIRWFDVSGLRIECKSPWGDSEYINHFKRYDNNFTIELQSGDKIVFTAKSYEIE